MSIEWIGRNLDKAVKGSALVAQILASNSRHLFYSPLYHPSLSPKEHTEARLKGLDEVDHRYHNGFHYGEMEVKRFANKRKKSLARKYGALKTLKVEVYYE